jgi:uncharacterized protein
MNQAIIDFVEGKRVAVLGASRTGKKFGNTVVTELKQRGYEVSIVHPEAKEIDGQPCSSNLVALKGQVDGVLICLPPGKAVQALRDAADAGIRNVWLQQGAETPDSITLAGELGLNLVTGKCILMYAQPVGSFHAWHRAFARLVGQL